MGNRLKIKVCGMRKAENIAAVAELAPEYMGFIFYRPSPRYAGSPDLSALPATIRKTGVFVDLSLIHI